MPHVTETPNLIKLGLHFAIGLAGIYRCDRLVEPFLKPGYASVGHPYPDLAQPRRLLARAIATELVLLVGACFIHLSKVARYPMEVKILQ